MSFKSIGKIYANTVGFSESGVRVSYVEFPENKRIHDQLKTFVRILKEYELLGDWGNLVATLYKFHSLVARSPCSPKWLYENMGTRQRLHLVSKGLNLNSVDPVVQDSFKNLVSSVNELSQIQENPNSDATKRIIEDTFNERSIIVCISNARLLKAAELALSIDSNSKERILTPTELRRHTAVDQLIFYGPPRLLDFTNQGFILRSGLAKKVISIIQDHEFCGKVPISLLSSHLKIQINGVRSERKSIFDHHIDPLVAFGNRAIAPQQTNEWAKLSDDTYARKVKARVFALGGNHGIFLEDASLVHIAIAKKTTLGPVCSDIIKTTADELDDNQFLVRTSTGLGDQTRPFADSLMGEKAKKFRFPRGFVEVSFA